MLTAQWHAQLMSAGRPFSIFSKAPRFTSGAADSVDCTSAYPDDCVAYEVKNS